MTDTTDNPTTHEAEPIDAHQLLRKHRMIGAIWCIEDVQEVRLDLTDDQAWEVLQEVERKHDAEFGISWTSLKIFADELFPQTIDE